MNKLVVKDRIASEVLDFCTEQEVRVINIRKSISTILLPETTQSPHQELFSPVKSVVLDVEENEIPDFNSEQSSKTFDQSKRKRIKFQK